MIKYNMTREEAIKACGLNRVKQLEAIAYNPDIRYSNNMQGFHVIKGPDEEHCCFYNSLQYSIQIDPEKEGYSDDVTNVYRDCILTAHYYQSYQDIEAASKWEELVWKIDHYTLEEDDLIKISY
ncbi:MAG: hypothetical protein K6F69_03855 [Treponema sp.]|nr:hypothetical protein [Treponema sp.]